MFNNHVIECYIDTGTEKYPFSLADIDVLIANPAYKLSYSILASKELETNETTEWIHIKDYSSLDEAEQYISEVTLWKPNS